MLDGKLQERFEGVAAARECRGFACGPFIDGATAARAAISRDIERDDRLARYLDGTVTNDFVEGFLSEM